MLWRRVLSISYIIFYCLLTNFYIGAPIFPLQLKCKLCWSELTLESQYTPVTRAVFHQIWRIDNIQKQKHSSKKMNLISSFIFCSKPIKSNIGTVSHQQLFLIIALNWNKSMFTWARSFQPVKIQEKRIMPADPQLQPLKVILPNISFYFLTSTNCLFPNDQWMSATFQMIYLLKDEKLLGNRSSNHFIWDWKGKRGKKDFALYFPHGIHKFDFPIWIQSGESTLTGILRFPSDNYWKDILSTFTKNYFDIVFQHLLMPIQ